MPPKIRVEVEKFWDQGYLLIRNVFEKAEVEKFRHRVFEGPPWKGDLLSHPHLRKVLLNDRVLSISAQLLGDTPVYYGDSGVSIGQNSTGFHKDNTDRWDANGPDWKGRYTQIRFGLYLQDHAWHSGGLRVMPRSHNAMTCLTGEKVNVRTRVGDLVVWNLRTDHDGRATLLRFFPWVYAERCNTGDWVPRYLVPLVRPVPMRVPYLLLASERLGRAALFFTMGRDDAHRERYTTYLKSRTYAVEAWKNSEYGPVVWEAVQGKNIKVIDVGEEVRRRLAEGDTSLGFNKDYVGLPY